jgi:hypothetical protein
MYVSEGKDPTAEGAELGYAGLAELETGETYASLLQ